MNKLKLLEKSFESTFVFSNLRLYYIISLFAMLNGFIYLPHNLLIRIAIPVSATLLILLIWHIQKKNYLNNIQSNFMGEIIFDSDISININEELITEDNIRSIKMDYQGFFSQGNQMLKVILSNYADFYFGTSNKIIIETISDSKIKAYLFLKDKSEKKLFYDLIELANKKNISVEETFRGKRSYGGKLLNYKQIQEYKKKQSTN